MILPYGVGLMMFDNMRNEAEDTLGSNFDVLEFNNVLLTYGDRPFEVVQADVDNYLANTTPGSSTSSSNNTSGGLGASNAMLFVAIGVLVAVGVVGALLIVRKKNNQF